MSYLGLDSVDILKDTNLGVFAIMSDGVEKKGPNK